MMSGSGPGGHEPDASASSSTDTQTNIANHQIVDSIYQHINAQQSANINNNINNINSSSSGASSSSNNNIIINNNNNINANGATAASTIGGDQSVDKTTPLDDKPRILIMGLRRSGKSSIQKVVFHKLSPNETLLLESTNKIVKDDISDSSFVSFVIWDFPGQIDFCDPTFDSKHIFGKCGALVFVIDAQDDYTEAMNKLHMTVVHAHKINPNITFEVFIHKVDGLSDDNKIEAQSNINIRANEDLMYAGYEDVRLSFYLTSIYDHTIFEAFSKVVQKLIRQLPTLANLLNFFISNSGIEKAFLFDVVTKIYIATDYAPVDMQSYELCCDMIDVIIDISCIYGVDDANDGSAFDEQSFSVIKLNNGTALYLREVNRFLALVCILREENLTEKQGVIDYNFQCFRRAINEVFELKNMRSMQSYESNCNLTTSSG